MKRIMPPLFSKKILGFVVVAGALSLMMIMLPESVCAGDAEKIEAAQVDNGSTGVDPGYQNYSGLADLVTMICEDALERFEGFYGSSVVMVSPFTTIGFFEKGKHSELGVALADQMVAMINNDTKDHLGLAQGGTKQELNGVLQEVDGYLRVHLSGVNAAGQRTSFVVIVEMSEPIYRALHTYL